MTKSLLEGLILKCIGGLYTVETPEGVFTCRARGIFRHRQEQLLAGDRVRLQEQPDGQPHIVELLPRKSLLQRPALANLDAVVVIASAAPPQTEPLLIDKVLAVAAHNGIAGVVCLNKCDQDPANDLYDIYGRAGFPVLRVSALTGEGIAALQELLAGRLAALTGNSGVGKSSILRRIHPNRPIAVGDLSEKLGRGRHITRHVELFPLPTGGYVADTPGFSAFDIRQSRDMLREDLQHAFIELRPYLNLCRFPGCSHTKEAGCAVLEAVAKGAVPASRHASYVRLYEELQDLRSWNLRQNQSKTTS